MDAMDIDMDIDLNLGQEEYMQDDVQHANGPGDAPPATSINLPDDPIQYHPHEEQPDKVHVRGLDNFSSADVKQFASEYFSLDQFIRIEWIDDTSANLIYQSEDAARAALAALTDAELLNMAAVDIPLLQLRPAKRLSTHPAVGLYVRQATNIDFKQKRAHEASRYYLMNPDKDPRERKRGEGERRLRRRGSDEGDYNKRRFDREHKRRREERGGFEASMYDEAGESSDTNDRRKRRRQGDLFGDRGRGSDGRLRGRSASPSFDGDGRMGFGSDDDPRDRRRIARRRSQSPFHSAGSRNAGKELFGSGPSKTSALSSKTAKELFPEKARSPVELFPAKTSTSPPTRELFPNKRQSFSNHRRTGAFDASGGDGGLFGSSGTPPPTRERNLTDRINGRPATADANEIRIRGAESKGFSIQGAAIPQSVKELFPIKSGNNAGKELFGEKIKGRGAPRRKAEDMFF